MTSTSDPTTGTERNDLGIEGTEYTKHLNIRDIGLDDKGDFSLEVDLQDIHRSRSGHVHGGMIFTLLDAALGRALYSQLPKGTMCPTIEMKINYFRPASTGKLIARGRIANQSKQLGYAEGEVLDEQGKIIARATGTFFIK